MGLLQSSRWELLWMHSNHYLISNSKFLQHLMRICRRLIIIVANSNLPYDMLMQLMQILWKWLSWCTSKTDEHVRLSNVRVDGNLFSSGIWKTYVRRKRTYFYCIRPFSLLLGYFLYLVGSVNWLGWENSFCMRLIESQLDYWVG